MTRGRGGRSRRRLMKAMHFRVERSPRWRTEKLEFFLSLRPDRRRLIRPGSGCRAAFGNQRQATCDKAAPAAAVMLHLRSCYVSKAAILTALVQLVPVE